MLQTQSIIKIKITGL